MVSWASDRGFSKERLAGLCRWADDSMPAEYAERSFVSTNEVISSVIADIRGGWQPGDGFAGVHAPHIPAHPRVPRVVCESMKITKINPLSAPFESRAPPSQHYTSTPMLSSSPDPPQSEVKQRSILQGGRQSAKPCCEIQRLKCLGVSDPPGRKLRKSPGREPGGQNLEAQSPRATRRVRKTSSTACAGHRNAGPREAWRSPSAKFISSLARACTVYERLRIRRDYYPVQLYSISPD